MKKSGFTLAEVLITLVIIGVIAAMTIPTLLSNTNKQETKTALKKAMSVINQAITLNYALTGNEMNTTINNTENLNKFMYSRTSILKYDATNKGYFTADGIAYYFNGTQACSDVASTIQSTGSVSGSTYSDSCKLTIDVNGDRGPNTLSGGASGGTDAPISNVEGIKDQFVFYILPQRVVPGQAAADILADKTIAGQ